MALTIAIDELVAFLIEAKLHTYASLEDEGRVPAILPGSHQLEFRQGDLTYRDIYYGAAFFAGQEVVYEQEEPRWTMVYSGGLLPGLGDLVTEQEVYAFLGAALRRASPQRPFRGPSAWQDCAWLYKDESQGDVLRFWGKESISFQGRLVYELRYQGGMLH